MLQRTSHCRVTAPHCKWDVVLWLTIVLWTDCVHCTVERCCRCILVVTSTESSGGGQSSAAVRYAVCCNTYKRSGGMVRHLVYYVFE